MRRAAFLLVVLLGVAGVCRAQFVRSELIMPDIAPYETLVCDFHTHTVFSDGNVWPSVRVDEAWSQGYDAIAVTDHIEYQPHRAYIPVQHNASFEIAHPEGERKGLAGRAPQAAGVEVRPVDRETVLRFEGEVDWTPSWENGFPAIRRIPDELLTLGATDPVAMRPLLSGAESRERETALETTLSRTRSAARYMLADLWRQRVQHQRQALAAAHLGLRLDAT